MGARNRAGLLWAYLRRRSKVDALPVEYIVETTAKCNLYCPMCPRETHKQPKEDMASEIFDRLVKESSGTAEHMMLIGLGEPLLDPKIFDRIEYCARHGISTLLSTNGTLLDEVNAGRLLCSPLEHITLSFDGATKESFEFYRKGARFEKVRDNFVRFCQMKKASGARVHIVVQMVRMERNAGEVDEFIRFWRSVPGVDQVRIKEDETNLMRPGAGHDAGDWKHPCLPLARPHVRETQRRRLSLLPELHAGRQAGGKPRLAIDRGDLELAGDVPNEAFARGKAGGRDRRLRALLYDDSTSAAGGGQPGFPRAHRAPRAAGSRAPGLLFTPPAEAAPPAAIVAEAFCDG